MSAAALPTAAAPLGHRIGPDDAPVALTVYGTYECLHCRRAWPALRALVDAHPGQVRVEWRHFAPPGAFPFATEAAAAAEAAAEQGAFWGMHEVLLAAPPPLRDDTLAAAAGALGLDAARLGAARGAPPVRARLDAQAAAAAAHGVRRTPTVLLHDAPLPDAWDLDAVAAAVRAAVALAA